MPDIWTIKAALDWTVGYLERKGDSQPRVSAEWLLSEACNLTRIELYTNFDKPLSMPERDILRDYVARRAAGEPLQLISGKAPFRYLSVKVAPGVLIPRPETEVLVSAAMAELNLPRSASRVVETEEGEQVAAADLPAISVIDVCTGSGCIACSIASEYPVAQVVALDISDDAVALAQQNVNDLGLAGRVEVLKSDLFEALPSGDATYDLIISNPPYVPSAVVDTLDREVTEFEPRLALDGGTDGLDLFRRMLPQAYDLLKANGVFAVELFEGHLEDAAELARSTGFAAVRIENDLTNRPRVLVCRK